MFDVRRHYAGIQKAVEPLLFDIPTLEGRSRAAEKILLKQLNEKRHNTYLETAVYHTLKQKGNLKTAGLADQVFISNRQLERVFREYMGISPKQFASLVRYQNLWNELLTAPAFDVMEAVRRYGFPISPTFFMNLKNITPCGRRRPGGMRAVSPSGKNEGAAMPQVYNTG